MQVFDEKLNKLSAHQFYSTNPVMEELECYSVSQWKKNYITKCPQLHSGWKESMQSGVALQAAFGVSHDIFT